ncbi:radical SAM/SPASM domain-containing protein [Stomatohabitans albus]|uniref:radical SAM/SPASM domain-containing protein n=1 Tax=Stomatohabitans albus TaxID=3110766 RepID=UPI00300C8101
MDSALVPSRTQLPLVTPVEVSPIRYLVLWPTAACDLDCVYCYRRDRRGGRMALETAERAVQTVLDDAQASGAPFHIQLAGGEPLLVPDVIDRVVDLVCSAGYSPKTIAVQTNATRIDANMAAQLHAWGIQVGVSLDGPPSVQDTTRGNAKATFGGLIHLAAFDVPVRITSVVSSINAHRLDELVVTAASFGNITGIALDLIIPLGSAATRPDLIPSARAIRCGIFEMYSALMALNRERRQPLIWRELETVRLALRKPLRLPSDHDSHIQPTPVSRYCFAVTGQCMAVSPNGAVYPCSQAVGDPTRQAGTIEAIDREALKQFNRVPPLSGPCTQCALAGRCPGDCPSRLDVTSPDNQHPLMCVIYNTLAQLEGAE